MVAGWASAFSIAEIRCSMRASRSPSVAGSYACASGINHSCGRDRGEKAPPRDGASQVAKPGPLQPSSRNSHPGRLSMRYGFGPPGPLPDDAQTIPITAPPATTIGEPDIPPTIG